MFPLLVTLAVAAVELAPECQAPATREVSPLATLAQSSGTVSAGLDSVATWCFDPANTWTGGHKAANAKAKNEHFKLEPAGDCARAIRSCEDAQAATPVETKRLLLDALQDMERPFLGVQYAPKRTGLGDRPPDAVDCQSHDRAMLFAQAQAQMDLARLAGQTQSEYGNYKAWLFSQGLKCTDALLRAKKDPLRKSVAIASASGNVTARVPTPPEIVPGQPSAAAPGPSPTAAESANLATATLSVRAQQEAAARGLHQDAGPSPGPEGIGTPRVHEDAVTFLAHNDAGTPRGREDGGREPASMPFIGDPGPGPRPSDGVALGGPTAEREKALSSSMLEKWRYLRSEWGKIETDADWLTGFVPSRELRDCRCVRPMPGEVVRRLENGDRLPQLETDDEKSTRCALCVLDAFPKWKSRSKKQCALALELTPYELGVLERSDDGNGIPPRCLESAKAKLGGSPAGEGKGSGAYIITKAPEAPPAPASDFVKPTDYAPMPAREEGRVYLRIFSSAACVTEVLPGPIQARTGDVLPIPPNAREITVRGPCGGFAEVYFGREEKPRVAEAFARNQPLLLRFRNP